uniref:Uncharacterized protein n=1 Tax=Arundo donax TaxID=35708 RepID=A0A0A9BGD9_ARUDO
MVSDAQSAPTSGSTSFMANMRIFFVHRLLMLCQLDCWLNYIFC